MPISRRHFLTLTATTAAGTCLLGGLQHLYSNVGEARSSIKNYRELIADPNRILDLPKGLTYRIISRLGDKMSDDSLVPNNFDGMAAFKGKNNTTILIRNHELRLNNNTQIVASPEKMYDVNCKGGTTTLILDRSNRLKEQYVSLAGTNINCAGGKMPWGSWISCEENTTMPGDNEPRGEVTKPHGYNFEVPISSKGVVTPIPLIAMGRFRHEAVQIDRRTGIIYQTEDDPTGLFYRFIPTQAGKLAKGGILEALKIIDRPQAITSTDFPVGQKFAVEWVRIDEPNPQKNTVKEEGFSKGAAQFMRGEGMCYANGSIYFTATQGGKILPNEPLYPNEQPRGNGQIWKYTPGKTAKDGGTIELFLEPNDTSILDLPDNITIAPNGDLIVCEDGKGEQRLIGIKPDGHTYILGRNALNNSEFAGACFSPDGKTMFVNIYDPGITLAISGF